LDTNGIPRIDRILPGAGIPGGDVAIYGSGFVPRPNTRPLVRFGETEASLLISAQNHLIARVPDGAAGGIVSVENLAGKEPAFRVSSRRADCRQSPSGSQSRGGHRREHLRHLQRAARPAGCRLAVQNHGELYGETIRHRADESDRPGAGPRRISVRFLPQRWNDPSRNTEGRSQLWVEGMGTATGIAFDTIGNLFVGDRSGTIFKISPSREIFVFATLEPSVAAYHLAFSPTGELFVTGPTTSSFDRVFRINQKGEISTFFRGLGRPQGLAFDRKGNLYVTASYAGRRGVVRIAPDGKAEQVLCGSGLVGIALLPGNRAILATSSALFSLDWDVEGLPLPR